MGQKQSKEPIEELYSSGNMNMKHPERRRKAKRTAHVPRTVVFDSTFDSGRHIDNVLSQMGVSQDIEEDCDTGSALFTRNHAFRFIGCGGGRSAQRTGGVERQVASTV